jgi:DNA-binding CsgD family transcriptional regulator
MSVIMLPAAPAAQATAAMRPVVLPRSGQLELVELWRGLLSGEYSIEEVSYEAERGFMVIAIGRARKAAIPHRDVTIVLRVLQGEPAKVVAADFGLSDSGVSTVCSKVLGQFGLERRSSSVSVSLVMAAHAAAGLELPPARVGAVSVDDGVRWTVNVEHPGTHLARFLTRSEHAVVRLALEGKTIEHSARARRVSVRTVANQLATAYKKLGISGRSALRAYAVREQAAQYQKSVTRVEPPTSPHGQTCSLSGSATVYSRPKSSSPSPYSQKIGAA